MSLVHPHMLMQMMSRFLPAQLLYTLKMLLQAAQERVQAEREAEMRAEEAEVVAGRAEAEAVQVGPLPKTCHMCGLEQSVCGAEEVEVVAGRAEAQAVQVGALPKTCHMCELKYSVWRYVMLVTGGGDGGAGTGWSCAGKGQCHGACVNWKRVYMELCPACNESA